MLLLPMLLLHKVNGRFSINHRTTNTGMAAAEWGVGMEAAEWKSLRHPETDSLCPHSIPDLQSIWGVGPISAPLFSFLVLLALYMTKGPKKRSYPLRNRLPWAPRAPISPVIEVRPSGDGIFEANGQHLLDISLTTFFYSRSFFTDWQTLSARVIVWREGKGRYSAELSRFLFGRRVL